MVALALFGPLILEAVAAQNAYQLDLKTPCPVASLTGYQCVVRIYGMWIDTASIPLFVNSVSVLLQALLFVSLSSLADHGRNLSS